MDPLRLNLTEVCNGCRKESARWMLQVSGPGEPDWAILFCPVCDRMTPEDLEVTDERLITLPRPTDQPERPFQLTFRGAEQYRLSMGPDRPFKQRDSKTMRRRYDMNGQEIQDLA